jgi:hypothetical protein
MQAKQSEETVFLSLGRHLLKYGDANLSSMTRQALQEAYQRSSLRVQVLQTGQQRYRQDPNPKSWDTLSRLQDQAEDLSKNPLAHWLLEFRYAPESERIQLKTEAEERREFWIDWEVSARSHGMAEADLQTHRGAIEHALIRLELAQLIEAAETDGALRKIERQDISESDPEQS